MSEPIKVGDLAAIVRWHSCGCNLGIIGNVTSSARISGTRCADCGNDTLGNSGSGFYVSHNNGKSCLTPVEWLKRIPPLSELEGQRTEEETREPA